MFAFFLFCDLNIKCSVLNSDTNPGSKIFLQKKGKKTPTFSDPESYRKQSPFQDLKYMFNLNFILPANCCAVKRKAVFKHVLRVTTVLCKFVQLCFEASSASRSK